MLSNRDEIARPVEHGETSYKVKYRELKRRLKYLVYENECFEKDIRVSRLKLLHINREKSFLLDQLIVHETLVLSDNSDMDSTDYSSEDEKSSAYPEMLSKKTHSSQLSGAVTSSPKQSVTKTNNSSKGVAKKTIARTNKQTQSKTTKVVPKATVTSTTTPTLIVSLPLAIGQPQYPPKLIPTVSTKAIGHDKKPSAIGGKGKRPIPSSSSGSSSSGSSNSESGSSDSSDSDDDDQMDTTRPLPPLLLDSGRPRSQSPIRIMPPSKLTSLSTIPLLSPSNPSPTITTKLLSYANKTSPPSIGVTSHKNVPVSSKPPSLVATTIRSDPINIGAFHIVNQSADNTLNNR